MKVLFIADVVGKPGRRAVSSLLPEIIESNHPDVIIANAENVAGGFGITEETALELFSYGIDILTTGNHLWDKKEIIKFLQRESRILRPANYPNGVPGKGYTILYKNNFHVAVLSLMGRVFLSELDDPFRVADRVIDEINKITHTIIIDMHAEATSEKQAIAFYLDGKVSAVIGTHTHVQTADESTTSNGTAYITDVGMTGAFDSIIGMKKEIALQRFLTQMPFKFEPASGDLRLQGVIINIDDSNGEARSIERIEKRLK